MIGLLLAMVLFETPPGGINGIDFKIESETDVIDPAKSVFLRVELKSPHDRTATMPDLQDRLVGFSLAEDFAENPEKGKDGSNTQISNWRLLPEPCANTYKVKPFVVKASPKIYKAQSDEGKFSFVVGPIYFKNPPPRETVTGGFEVDPKKDISSYLWKHAGTISLCLAGIVALLIGVFALLKYLHRRVKEHFMSPIERAWAELDRLIGKGLPGRGRYKDFYVELTMVVRRYVQRKYGIKAPHLTTEEFLREFKGDETVNGERGADELKKFLESADMVKFAGVEATPEMADDATDSARNYLKSDSTETTK